MTKKEFRWFTIFEYEKEQVYLRQQHQNGWRLVRVTGLGMYHFEQCTPEDVVYQLDYNQEGSANRAQYTQMFADCGWEYIQDLMGYSYFRKRAADMGENETGIFCDHESRMAMWDRVFKGRVRILLIMLCCVIIPQLVIQSHNHVAGDFFVGVFMGLLLVYLVILIRFARKYRQAQGKQ